MVFQFFNIQIGNNVILWSNVGISHDSTIEDHNFIAGDSITSGFTTIEEYCFIGPSTKIINGINIGRETFSMGGVVLRKSTKPKSVYVPPQAALFPKKSDELY